MPPGSNGFLIASASRFVMPSNIAVTGARTAFCSGVAACSDEIRMPVAVAPAKRKSQQKERKIFMALDCKPWKAGHRSQGTGNSPAAGLAGLKAVYYYLVNSFRKWGRIPIFRFSHCE